MFWRPTLVWFALGSIGLVFVAAGFDLGALRAQAALPDLPDPLLRALLVVQPAVLLVAGILIGVGLAHKVGLASGLTNRLQGREAPPWSMRSLLFAVLWGIAIGLAVVVADTELAPLTGLSTQSALPGPVAIAAALSYGGISEELMMRYGLMTLLVWLGARIWRSRPPALYWAAILFAALLFGAGHLPAMAVMAPLTPAVIVRTVALNFVPAVLFGWLYWRRTLEHAMLAHMAAHVGMWAAVLVL